MKIITAENIRGLLRGREKNSHKGTYGKCLFLAGSEGMYGAASLTLQGALRSGAGLVILAADKKYFTLIQQSVPEAILLNRTELYKNWEAFLKNYDVLVMGPGLSLSQKSGQFMEKTISSFEGPIVLDADGLNWFAKAGKSILLKEHRGQLIITPHPGEAVRLLGVDKKEYENLGREKVAKELALLVRSVAVLKGNETIIASHEGDISVNSSGNPGMATAGSGDILTGVIGALLGSGLDGFEAACLGVYIHGLAGDIAKEKYGEIGMIASDIVNSLPEAFIRLERGNWK